MMQQEDFSPSMESEDLITITFESTAAVEQLVSSRARSPTENIKSYGPLGKLLGFIVPNFRTRTLSNQSSNPSVDPIEHRPEEWMQLLTIDQDRPHSSVTDRNQTVKTAHTDIDHPFTPLEFSAFNPADSSTALVSDEAVLIEAPSEWQSPSEHPTPLLQHSDMEKTVSCCYCCQCNQGLFLQSLISLLFCLVGLVCAGYLLDNIQHWQVFEKVSELVILVPVLLSLKGNLEMNLSSRISTAANINLLDDAESRRSILTGNIALMLTQGISIGFLAGVFSSILGLLIHTETNGQANTLLIYAASMWTAGMSGLILGLLMCGIVLLSKRFHVNPDNISTPLAASLGDLVTLGVLSLSAQWLYSTGGEGWSIALICLLSLVTPAMIYTVLQNDNVKKVLTEGWVPLIVSVFISSFGGLVLERYIGQYKSMAVLSTVLNGLVGNIGAVYCSRIATSLHGQTPEKHTTTVTSLCLVSLPIQMIFLTALAVFEMGHTALSLKFLILYMITSTLILFTILIMSRKICLKLWQWGYNPHNYALPYVTGFADIMGTMAMVAVLAAVN